MAIIDIGGVKVQYSSIQELGVSAKKALTDVEEKLIKLAREHKRLRRARQALKKMLGDHPANMAATDEPAA
jgi:hypothetical protein